MKRVSIYIYVFLSVVFITPAAGQNGGQIGIFADAQFLPQAGVTWHLTDRIQARGGVYFEDRGVLADLAILYRWGLEGDLGSYLGPNLTLNDLTQDVGFGILAGTDVSLHSRVRLFGEIGLSYVNDNLNMWNTGVGVVYYLTRRSGAPAP